MNELTQLIEAQVQHELQASAFYKALSMQLNSLGYFGASKYFEKQSDEERQHAFKFERFLNDYYDITIVYPSTTAESPNVS